MTEVELDFPRMFVEFADPATADRWFRADLTWLTSRWQCIFGNGCHGVYADRPDDGCCTLGAHYSDKADRKRVEAAALRLPDHLWQRSDAAGPNRKHVTEADEEGSKKTRVVDGGCIFLNDPDFSGGSGCAFHHAAREFGVAYHELKPDVCWQLPIRRTYETRDRGDGTEIDVIVIGEFDRRGWGSGGHDLDWYCTGSPLAHTASRAVYQTEADTLIALMGEPAYRVLEQHCQRWEASGRSATPHPADPA